MNWSLLTRDGSLKALQEEERLTKGILELRKQIAAVGPVRGGGGGGGGGGGPSTGPGDGPPAHLTHIPAADGQTLQSQNPDVQATYSAVHGDQAPHQWAIDHNQAIGTPGFQHGGRFRVGGQGGIDQNLVMFRASRGEEVAVTPTGESGGGGTQNHFYGDFYGLDDLAERVGEAGDLGSRIGLTDALGER